MVSAKWICQVSLALAFFIDAAQPPSAITVCALPNSDLVTTATRRPRSRASITARSPAPPAPMTTTSYSCRSIVDEPLARTPSDSAMNPHLSRIDLSANESQVGNGAAGDQHDVEVGHHQRAERDPRVQLVACVQLADLRPEPVAHRVFGEVLEPATRDVPAGVAGQRVHPQHDDVDDEYHVAQPESEATGSVVGMEGDDGVVGVDHRDD